MMTEGKAPFIEMVPSATQVDDLDISDCEDAAIVGYPNVNAAGYQVKLRKQYTKLAAMLGQTASEERLPVVHSGYTLMDARNASQLFKYWTLCARNKTVNGHDVSWGNHFRPREDIEQPSPEDVAIVLMRRIFQKREELRVLNRPKTTIAGEALPFLQVYMMMGAPSIGLVHALSTFGFLTCNRTLCPDGVSQVESWTCLDPLAVPSGEFLYCPDGAKALRRFHCNPMLVVSAKDETCITTLELHHRLFAVFFYVLPALFLALIWLIDACTRRGNERKLYQCKDDMKRLLEEVMSTMPVGNIVPLVIAV